MQRLGSILCLLAASVAQGAAPPRHVVVTIETTLATAKGQVRQFAFDGDPSTCFVSASNAGRADHFTLVFDRPVAVRSIVATTGRPAGGDTLDAGALEVSADGKKFEELAKFTAGVARANGAGRQLVAVRIRPTADLKHPLVVRDIAIDSAPALAVFKYPVEFIVNVDDAPEMRVWAEEVARLCERWYPRIVEELNSPGFKPTRVVTMTLTKRYNGVAYAGGGRITGSVNYFKKRPTDKGAMIHETVHIVQRYRGRGNPGWLVEGVADYIRFYKYEPGKLRPISPNRARYNGSYQVTARFLGYLTEKYDRDIVRKLNQAMREGEYNPVIFKKLTGKTVEELGKEWQASLRR
jgi:hypothetical protein